MSHPWLPTDCKTHHIITHCQSSIEIASFSSLFANKASRAFTSPIAAKMFKFGKRNQTHNDTGGTTAHHNNKGGLAKLAGGLPILLLALAAFVVALAGVSTVRHEGVPFSQLPPTNHTFSAANLSHNPVPMPFRLNLCTRKLPCF